MNLQGSIISSVPSPLSIQQIDNNSFHVERRSGLSRQRAITARLFRKSITECKVLELLDLLQMKYQAALSWKGYIKAHLLEGHIFFIDSKLQKAHQQSALCPCCRAAQYISRRVHVYNSLRHRSYYSLTYHKRMGTTVDSRKPIYFFNQIALQTNQS